MSAYSVRVTAAEAAVVHRLLAAFGTDMPTPQFARVDEAVEVQWLVDGTFVEVWTDGTETDLTAYGADGSVLWEYELAPAWTADDAPIRVARELLSVMAQGVKFPVLEGRLVVA